MKLEREFRLCLQRQLLEAKLQEILTTAQPEYEPSEWVKLLSPPTAFSADEALLLCQCSETEWVAWVPDYGEIVLNIRQFCRNLPC
jgi:hypothetical protein